MSEDGLLASVAQDEFAMRLALDQALNAQLSGEVPVGAVITRLVDGGDAIDLKNMRVICFACNQEKEQTHA